MHPLTLVSICICTCRRPDGLRHAVLSIVNQHIPANLAVEIVIVDNDPACSAQPVFEDLLDLCAGTRLVFLHEPRPGISFARNRCLDAAQGDAVAFLDDDEVALPGWFSAIWETLRRYEASAVFGPVVPKFETEPPSWLTRSSAHQRPRFKTGMPIGWGDARTGNVLMSRQLIDMVGEFDPRFTHTGGEDAFFFGLALKRGARLVWCDEAVVEESVPEARMQRAWLLRRAFLGGRTFTRLRAELGASPAVYLSDGLRAAGAIAIHVLPALFQWAIGNDGYFRHARKIAGGLGKLGASFVQAGDYGNTPPRPVETASARRP